MDRLSRNELLTLASPGTAPRVSIYLPLERAYPDAHQNPVRLRNALNDAEKQLLEQGLSASAAKHFLASARTVSLSDASIPLDATSGLALLVEEGRHSLYLLPYSCPESLDVGTAFHLVPLARLLVWPFDFQMLALSGKGVRLFRGTRREMAAVQLPSSVPHSLEEFLRETQTGQPTRFQTGVGSGPAGASVGIVHGGTSYKDEQHSQIREYVHSVAKHVAPLTGKDNPPLVLIAVAEVHSLFRTAYPEGNLIDPGVHGSPDELGLAEMRTLAADLVETRPTGETQAVLIRYQRASGTAHASDDVRQIIPAAVAGRVDSILASHGARLWGSWDAAAQRVEVAASQSAPSGSVDLIDLALAESLRHGGHVCVVPKSEMPNHALLASVFRW